MFRNGKTCRRKYGRDESMDKIPGASEELVYLRPMEEADADSIVTWRNKEWVRRNFIYQKPFTREGQLNWLHTQVEPGHVAQFIICEKNAGRPVGSVYFRDIDRIKKCAEYGIFIGEEDAVGKGYGTQAARLALHTAFVELGLESVFLRVFEDNIGARKSYEKAGFLPIKDRREKVITENGGRTILFYERKRR